MLQSIVRPVWPRMAVLLVSVATSACGDSTAARPAANTSAALTRTVRATGAAESIAIERFVATFEESKRNEVRSWFTGPAGTMQTVIALDSGPSGKLLDAIQSARRDAHAISIDSSIRMTGRPAIPVRIALSTATIPPRAVALIRRSPQMMPNDLILIPESSVTVDVILSSLAALRTTRRNWGNVPTDDMQVSVMTSAHPVADSLTVARVEAMIVALRAQPPTTVNGVGLVRSLQIFLPGVRRP